MDHNVPTKNLPTINDPIAKKQITTLAENAKEFGVQLADIGHPGQGIVHVIGPELGLTQPGKTMVTLIQQLMVHLVHLLSVSVHRKLSTL